MSYYFGSTHVLDNLVGRTVTAIHLTEHRLVLDTDAGRLAYEVEGDCCSYSYFHDFYGVEHLLNNGPVTEVSDAELDDSDPRFNVDNAHDECVQVYGYKITTVHPTWGEVTSVLSFRNSSNGYYGGWMGRVESDDTAIPADARQLMEDFTGE